MDNQLKEILQQTIQELLAKMDFGGRVEVVLSEDEHWVVKIESEEAGLLIGQGGGSLAALEHLARAIINKKFGPQSPRFAIDVNNYRFHRLELLKDMALGWAKQVLADKQIKVLEPMSAYERRVVHLTLSSFQGVETESQGEGKERRIIIRPSDGRRS